MIQRIQTVLLALAAILAIVFLFIPWISEGNMLSSGKDYIELILPAALAALISGVTIFLYNNRPLQIKLTWLAVLLNLAAIAVMFILLLPDSGYTLKAGLAFPPLAVLFNLLAAMFISKDEKLVRSADRFR